MMVSGNVGNNKGDNPGAISAIDNVVAGLVRGIEDISRSHDFACAGYSMITIAAVANNPDNFPFNVAILFNDYYKTRINFAIDDHLKVHIDYSGSHITQGIKRPDAPIVKMVGLTFKAVINLVQIFDEQLPDVDVEQMNIKVQREGASITLVGDADPYTRVLDKTTRYASAEFPVSMQDDAYEEKLAKALGFTLGVVPEEVWMDALAGSQVEEERFSNSKDYSVMCELYKYLHDNPKEPHKTIKLAQRTIHFDI